MNFLYESHKYSIVLRKIIGRLNCIADDVSYLYRMNFEKYIANAKTSKFGLWKFNFGLGMMIPFNKPHKIKIKQIEDDKVDKETFVIMNNVMDAKGGMIKKRPLK